MHPSICIEPDLDLIDRPVTLKITDLQRNDVVTLEASMHDNFGEYWTSSAVFKADDKGRINLATDRPLSGSYADIDVHGLFWSMRPVANLKQKMRTPLKPLETTVTVQKDQEMLATASMERQLISPKVKSQSVCEQELVGTLFYHPNENPLPTLIVLGGSEGGLQEGDAALLASYGFNTLALAYFGIENLPKELVKIPVDYIELAITWLCKQPCVDAQRLGMMGTSKGGELALLCASMFPEIKAVVGFVPSSVVYQGISQEAVKSSWTYRGKELPFANGHIPASIVNRVHTGTDIMYRDWYKHVAAGETQAEIRVENIQGPILLISGGADTLWPADDLSEKAIERLRKNKHPYDYEHVTYPEAGHAFGIPGLPTTRSMKAPFFGGKNLLLGGNPKENAAAQRDAWQRVKSFFKLYLA